MAVLFVDAMWVKIRDGMVTNGPVYVVVGVDFTGAKHVLGLWIGKDGEGAKYWMAVLALRNRGVADVCFVCCDGLTGLPQAVTAVWPEAIVQTCVVHLIRGSMRYASKRDIALVNAGLKPIYTAPSEQAAADALDALDAYPNVKFLVDAGYRGPAKDHPEQVIAPPLKPTKDAPPDEIAAYQTARKSQSSQRIPAEYAIAAIKWWRTLQRFTGRRNLLPEVIRAAAGLASDRAAAR